MDTQSNQQKTEEKNHILIALGGRGGDTLKAFRKLMYKNAMKEPDPDTIVNNYAIEYIYLDSSSNDLNNGWTKDLGIDYGIPDWAKVNVRKNVSLTEVLNNTSSYPAVVSWKGDHEAWKNVSLDSEVGAGQLRKVGRMYFTANNMQGDSNSFSNVLEKAYSQVTKKGEKKSGPTIYHIVVGIAGGTGSGTIVDVIAQVKKFYELAGRTNDRILIYVILPERNPVEGKDVRGLYHANAFSALVELNAIGLADTLNHYYPYEVVDLSVNNLTGTDRIKAGFSSAFLFSEENSNGDVIDYKDGLPNMVANFLYQRIVSLPKCKPSTLDEWVKLTENSSVKHETDKFTAVKERAIKFTSAGFKRIEIPEIEIIDLFGAQIMEQLILQQKHNNWVEGKGYINEKGQDITVEFVDKVGELNIKELCGITLNKLSLKTPNDSNRNSDEEWDTTYTRIFQVIQGEYDKGNVNLPIQRLSNEMNEYYERLFRGSGMGVHKYWEEKTKTIEQEANYFYKKIETALLDIWVGKKGKPLGLDEIIKVIDRFVDELKQIGKIATNKKNYISDTKKVNATDSEPTLAYLNTNIAELTEKFSKLLNFNKRGTFEAAANKIKILYKTKTDIKAFDFTVKLVDNLEKKLVELRKDVQKIKENLNSAEEKIKKLIDEKNKVFDENDGTSFRKHGVKSLINKEQVVENYKILINQKDRLNQELQDFRAKLFEYSGKSTFSELSSYFNSDKLLNEYLFELNLRISPIYKDLLKDNYIKHDEKIIDRNILDYFKNHPHYSTISNLEKFLKDIIDSTYVYSDKLKDSEPNNKRFTLVDSISNYAVERLFIQYPIYTQDKNYADEFEKMLKNIFPEAVIDHNVKDNEIVVFRGKAPMSLRSFDLVKGKLNQSYTNSLKPNPNFNVANLTLHTENNPKGSSYPKLFPIDNDKIKEVEFYKLFENEFLSDLIIAFGIGFIEKIENKYFLKEELSVNYNLIELTEDNFKFYDISKKLLSNDYGGEVNDGTTIRMNEALPLSERLTTKIKNNNKNYLSTREMKKKENRDIVINKINNEIVPRIFEIDYEKDITDSQYSIFMNSVKKAISYLNTI
jgi:hypothetical protein